LIGVIAYFVIAGPRFLIPGNVAWLVGGDPLFHYLGWAFFRNSPWSWPIGLNPLYGMDFSNSIVFSDSIPLFAILFKAVSGILGHPFQYFGIWTLFCFVMQAVLAYRLVGLISNSAKIQALGSVLFLFSPPLLFRLSLHASLMAHFLILVALYLSLKPLPKPWDSRVRLLHPLSWMALMCLAITIHFYLAVMVIFLWVSDLASRTVIQKFTSYRSATFEMIAMTLFTFFVEWQTGYFAIQSGAGASGGFGDFRTNLLALFNSRAWSYFLPPIDYRDSVEIATGEGFQFLGTGSLFLLLCALFSIATKRMSISSIFTTIWGRYRYLLSALVLMALISFSNHIGIGAWNIRIPFPEKIIALFGFVRSSSRLFWPMYYMILFVSLYCVIRSYGSRYVILILGLAAALQVVDTSAGWLPIRAKISLSPTSEFKTVLKNSFWRNAGLHYQNVVSNGREGVWEDFGVYASQYRMATNIVRLARVDGGRESDFFNLVQKQLNIGPLNSKSLYILGEWKLAPDKAAYSHISFNPDADLLARIDGFNILAPGWKTCNTCSQVDPSFHLIQLQPKVQIGEVIHFDKTGDGRSKFMLNGWGYTEDWGTWATQPVASVVIPLPKGGPSKLIVKANAFIASPHPGQSLDIVINGSIVIRRLLLKQSKGNIFEINLPKGLGNAGEAVQIDFHSLSAISPKSAGLGQDERQLGIGLVSMAFAR
jgi:hypothetical protein